MLKSQRRILSKQNSNTISGRCSNTTANGVSTAVSSSVGLLPNAHINDGVVLAISSGQQTIAPSGWATVAEKTLTSGTANAAANSSKRLKKNIIR